VRDPERGYQVDSAKTPQQISDFASQWHFFPWNLIDSKGAGLSEIPTADLSAALNSLRDYAIDLVDSPAFETARTEDGVPLFGVDFDDRNLPQEVGRNELAISFTKGCYLGQETVARIDALGHVNQQLAGVRFVGVDLPEPGAVLSRDGHDAGRVTSAIYSPRLQAPLALAMLRRELAAVGNPLDSPVGACEVVGLPV
jgi:folate-binding protein YgfZ